MEKKSLKKQFVTCWILIFTVVDVLVIGQWKSTYLSTAVWLVDVDVVVVPCSAMLKHIRMTMTRIRIIMSNRLRNLVKIVDHITSYNVS